MSDSLIVQHRRIRTLLCAVCALAAGCAARGDFAATIAFQVSATNQACVTLPPNARALADVERAVEGGLAPPTMLAGALPADASRAGDSIQQLPATPDSTLLLIWGLASIGLYHAGRSARHIHFDRAPDWYHSGAPQQIGHAYALSLDDLGAQAIWAPSANAGRARPAPLPLQAPGLATRLRLNHFSVPTLGPRAPPAFS